MSTLTDNPAEVGMHVFERAGLGKAPFACVGMGEKTYCACQGAPVQPAGTCDYCGNCIRYVFQIRSADGKLFGVGCDCVNKTQDAGLIRAYKNRPEYRKLQREKRAAKAAADLIELDTLLRERAADLERFPATSDKSPNLYQHVVWWRNHAGASGRASVLRFAKRVLRGEIVHKGGYYQEEKI
jgi:hypothetical protein